MSRRVAVAALALAAIVGCRRGAPPGACRVVDARALSASASETPLSMLASGGAVYTLTLTPRGDGVVASVYRARGGDAALLSTVAATSGDAVSGLVATPQGPAFAYATRAGVVVRQVDPTLDVTLPQAEVPCAHAGGVRRLALAADGDHGFSALVGCADAAGTRRLHTRDVGVSASYTPPRHDVFGAPALAVLGATVVLVQQRSVGDFLGPPRGASVLEVVTVGAALSADHEAHPVAITAAQTGPLLARLASVDPATNALEVSVVYRSAQGVFAAMLAPDAPTHPRAHRLEAPPQRLDDAPPADRALDLGAPAVVSLPARCGMLYGWLRATQRGLRAELQRATLNAGAVERAGPPLVAEQGTRAGRASLRLARVGDRVVLAVDGGSRVAAYDVAVDAACAPSLRALSSRAERLVDLVADEHRAVLATGAPADGGTRVTFTSLYADGRQVAQPAPEQVTSEARAVALLGDVLVVGGAVGHLVRLDRFEGAEHEDLDVVDSRGDDFALTASAGLDRVWVADASGSRDTTFGPADAVILHSFVGALDDGPRTEDWMAVVPHADFARITLDRATSGADAEWATTWSAASSPDGACLPGVYVARHRAPGDQPVDAASGDDAWPGARAVVDAASRTCRDRVGGVVWEGTAFALTVLGPRVGARLVLGDSATNRLRATTLEAPSDAAIAPGLARMGRGFAVAWVGPGAAVRVARFDRDGRPVGAPLALPDRVAASDGAALAGVAVASLGEREFAVALPTARGPRVTRVACDPAR